MIQVKEINVRTINLILLVAAFAGWSGCSNRNNTFETLYKLEGIWVMNLGETQIYESWQKIDEKSMQGISYEITGQDSAVSEHIQLRMEGEDIFYIPTVADQNEGKPVSFKLTYQSDSLVVFENPEHDFPTKIAYKFTGNDLLDATISGEIKGNVRSLDFNYKRYRE